MSKAPRNGWRVLAWCLFLAGGAACGRTDFDTGASVAASGTGGTAGSAGTSLLPATPGLVICGDSLCNSATQHCCFGVATSGSVTAGCSPLGTACTGVSVQCDEPADCGTSGAKVCCAGLGGATSAAALLSSLGTQCVAASACSGTGQFLICSKDSDCHGAGVCCAADGVPTCLATCPKI